MKSKLSRNNFLKAGLAVAVAALFAAGIGVKMAVAGHTPHNSKKHKMVLQLNDPNWKHAMFVLGNAKNIYKGVGAKNIDLELVVFGPALKNFTNKNIKPQLKARLESLQLDGLKFGVCGNTMKRFKITLNQLPQSSNHLKQGGIVRVMEAQEEGYAYARP